MKLVSDLENIFVSPFLTLNASFTPASGCIISSPVSGAHHMHHWTIVDLKEFSLNSCFQLKWSAHLQTCWLPSPLDRWVFPRNINILFQFYLAFPAFTWKCNINLAFWHRFSLTEIHVIHRCHLLSNKTFYCVRGIHFINHCLRTANGLIDELSVYPIRADYFS